MPANERTADQLAAIERGGYALVDGGETPQAVIMASGSEVELAVKAAAQLGEKGMPVRVVSVPCLDRFMAQDKAWRDSVIPPSVKARLAIEAGVPDSWWRLVGDHGDVVGMTTYGESAPAGELFKHFGFTVDNVVSRMESLLG